jgi:hypothetical protein
MHRCLLAVALLALSAFTSSGCAIQCGASAAKLAELRPGMSYSDASRVMGCPGSPVAGGSPNESAFAIVEWDGPDSLLFRRTRIEFVDGKVVFYTTEYRGAL